MHLYHSRYRHGITSWTVLQYPCCSVAMAGMETIARCSLGCSIGGRPVGVLAIDRSSTKRNSPFGTGTSIAGTIKRKRRLLNAYALRGVRPSARTRKHYDYERPGAISDRERLLLLLLDGVWLRVHSFLVGVPLTDFCR